MHVTACARNDFNKYVVGKTIPEMDSYESISSVCYGYISSLLVGFVGGMVGSGLYGVRD